LLQAILQVLGSRGLNDFEHFTKLCRCVMVSQFRSDGFMELLCEEGSKRMVMLATAAPRETALMKRKRSHEVARLSADTLHACATLDYHPGQAFLDTLDECVMQSVSRTLPSCHDPYGRLNSETHLPMTCVVLLYEP